MANSLQVMGVVILAAVMVEEVIFREK